MCSLVIKRDPQYDILKALMLMTVTSPESIKIVGKNK
jgi:hypothetical protein